MYFATQTVVLTLPVLTLSEPSAVHDRVEFERELRIVLLILDVDLPGICGAVISWMRDVGRAKPIQAEWHLQQDRDVWRHAEIEYQMVVRTRTRYHEQLNSSIT